MNSKVFNYSQTLLITALILFFTITPAGAFKADAKHPFDLSKIPMDDSWEDTGIVAADIAPCGENMLYMELGSVKDGQGKVLAWKIAVWDIATGVSRSAEVANEGDYSLIGCTPDSRFLFFNQKGAQGADSLHPNSLTVYDTATMQVVKALPHPDHADSRFQHLSPDGRYLAWYTDEEIVLPDGRKIKAIPLLPEFGRHPFDVAWSGDSKTFYMLSMEDRPQHLIIQNVETGKRRVMDLAFTDREHVGMNLLVHPVTGRVYIQAGYDEYDGMMDVRFLYMLDPTKIPYLGRAVKVSPALLGKVFAGITFGPDNTIIFSLAPKSDVDSSAFPPKYNGLFVANLQGAIVGQITRQHDLDPAFMEGKHLLVFQREIKIPDYGWVWKYVVYRKKSAPARSLMSPK